MVLPSTNDATQHVAICTVYLNVVVSTIVSSLVLGGRGSEYWNGQLLLP